MTQDELRQLIARAAAERWEELDLRDQELTELPPEIGQLTQLRVLRLGKTKWNSPGNRLTELPPEIGQLTNLIRLDLSSNQLTAVPPEIGQLTSLTQLNLGGNQLTAVPPEIGQLTSLISLDLSNNQLTAVPPEITQLPRLTELYFSDNQLTIVPPEIGQLSQLTRLYLSDNQLTAMPPEITQLTRLTVLDLRYNQLTVVPPEIGNLTRLTRLYLGGNQLTVVPPEITQLTRLTRLYLHRNQLTAVPPEIGQLTSLISLDFSNNQLTAVPPEIGQLTSLETLKFGDFFGGNNLNQLPPEIGQLTSLTRLDLSSNQLTGVSLEIIQLTNLTVLDLGSNQLTTIPPEIIQLTNLTVFNLQGNRLTALPDTMRHLPKLELLDLEENPLPLPQELLENIDEPDLILEAYFAGTPLREAKMLLVGQGGVGKTSLARRLLHDQPLAPHQDKTPGVDIHHWQLPTEDSATDPKSKIPNPKSKIRINLWDFGGQGVYQATHQFFFTSRSLYLVVIDARTGERESRLHHWLRLVSALSDHAPIILVVNKIDQHPLQLDERDLKAKYRNLRAVAYTSCQTEAGMDDLRREITAAIADLPRINDRFPENVLALKARLEQMQAEEKPYITYEQFEDYCAEAGIDNPDFRRAWAGILNQLGVILNFRDDQFRQLEGTHVLNPEWVTEGVYRILTDPQEAISQNGGVLTPSMLDAILDSRRHPRHQRHFLLGMMERFELAFPVPGRQNQYLIPDLLPPQSRTGFLQGGQRLEFQIHYLGFMPTNILSRLMVRMMAALDGGCSWRAGAALRWEENRALVTADEEARRITIRIEGAETTLRSFLNSIRMNLQAIHGAFPALNFSEEIPLPGHPGHTVPYKSLLNHEKRGRQLYYDGELDEEFEVQTLLAGIETPEMRRERALQQQILDGCNLEGIQQLCFDLDVPYDDLPGQTRSAKARELALYLSRKGRLAELEQTILYGTGGRSPLP